MTRSALVLALILTTAPGARSAEPNIDYLVLGVTGFWTPLHCDAAKDDPADRLRFGDILQQDMCVVGTAGTLLLWFETGQTVYRCDQPNPGALDERCRCARGQTSPPTPAENRCIQRLVKPPPSGFTEAGARMTRAIIDQLKHGQRRWITAVSRGFGPQLKDAVVPLRGKQLDISTALAEMQESAYSIQLEPFDGGASTGPLEVTWSKSRGAFVAAAEIKPGMYRLTLLDKALKPTHVQSVILIVPAERFEGLAADYREFEQFAESLPEGTEPGAKRLVRQVYLKVLESKMRSPIGP